MDTGKHPKIVRVINGDSDATIIHTDRFGNRTPAFSYNPKQIITFPFNTYEFEGD